MKKISIFKYCASLAMGLALSSSLCASYDVTTVAGTGTAGYSGDGGLATAAKIRGATEICIDNVGIIYFADFQNSCIRKIALDGTISTVAGIGGAPGASGSGVSATSTSLTNPIGLCVDAANNLYIADTYNYIIQKFTVGGIITTIAGTGLNGFSGDGGLATPANIGFSTSIAIDSLGRIYFTDMGNGRVRMFTEGGNISTIAGGGTGGDGGLATSASIIQPAGVCLDNLGNIYVTELGRRRVRRFTIGSNISTIAGTGTAGFSGDGGPATSARLNNPYGIDIDNFGNLYIADLNNNRYRKLLPPSITLEVNGTDSAIVSAALAATTVHKTGGGTAVLSGNNSSVSILALKAGLVKVSATNNIGKSVTFAGGNMEVTSGTVAIPTAAMNAAATITTDVSAAVSSIAAPSGTSLLTLAGPGVVTAGNMSASYTPLSIPGVMHVGASSSSKMTSGSAVVPSGGLVKIMGATASSVPGDTQLQSGAVLEVADSVTVPAHTGADIFGTLKFDTGAILKLGVGATWARNISIGTAL